MADVKVRTTTTVTRRKTVEMDEDELKALLLAHFELPSDFTSDVSFHTTNYGDFNGVTITHTVQETSEDGSDV